MSEQDDIKELIEVKMDVLQFLDHIGADFVDVIEAFDDWITPEAFEFLRK